MSRQSWVETLWWQTSDGTAVANSVAETIWCPDQTILANYMADGRVLHLINKGRYSSTATPTIRFRVRWGGVAGVVLWDSGTITVGSAVTAALCGIDVWLQTRSNGSSGTIFAMGNAIIGSALAPTVGSATGAPAFGEYGSAGDDTPAAATVDLTTDKALSVTVQWGTQSASNTTTSHIGLGVVMN